jgi:hypothetical protein
MPAGRQHGADNQFRQREPRGLRAELHDLKDPTAKGRWESWGGSMASTGVWLHTRYMAPAFRRHPLQKPSPTFKIGRTRNSSQRIRVVDPLRVAEQRIAQRTDLKQLVPIATGAGEAGHFHAEHHADAPQSNLGHETLKPKTPLRWRSRAPLVFVDHQDAFPRPPKDIA